MCLDDPCHSNDAFDRPEVGNNGFETDIRLLLGAKLEPRRRLFSLIMAVGLSILVSVRGSLIMGVGNNCWNFFMRCLTTLAYPPCHPPQPKSDQEKYNQSERKDEL